MKSSRTVLVAVLVLIGLAGASIGGAAIADVGLTSSTDDEPESSLGEDVSSFMQSSAADTSERVDDGMFDVSYRTANGDDERAAVVSDRTQQLEARYERLQDEYEELKANEDEMNPVAYNAQLSRIASQLHSLEESVNKTAPLAADHGVDTERLAELRENAHSMTGQEVAEHAKGLAGVDPPGHNGTPPGLENGPPGLENKPGNVGSSDDNGDRGPPGDRDRGPPGDDDDRGPS